MLVSQGLYDTIQELMKVPSLKDFLLGGGTNLAIKYSHRESTDIDLFCSDKVSFTEFSIIKNELEKLFENTDLTIKNKEVPHAIFCQGHINNIKIDLIQNIPFEHSATIIDNIRLVNDLDIGALKLISAADRGSRKDFFDLDCLSDKHSLNKIFDEYLNRKLKFSSEDYKNLFSIHNSTKKELSVDLTPLGNFTNANRNQENTFRTSDNRSWFDIRTKWEKKVSQLAASRNIHYEKTSHQRKNNRGFRL